MKPICDYLIRAFFVLFLSVSGASGVGLISIVGPPPMPVGTLVVLAGDSMFRLGAEYTVSGSRLDNKGRCELCWANALLDMRFVSENWFNVGSGGFLGVAGADQGQDGDEANIVLQRLPAIIAALDKNRPILLALRATSNVQAPDDNAPTAIANIQQCIDLWLAASPLWRVAVSYTNPHGITPDSDPNGYHLGAPWWGQMLEKNVGIAAMASQSRVYVVNSFQAERLNDGTEIYYGQVKPGLTTDGTHQTNRGAFVRASAVNGWADILDRIIRKGTWVPWDTATNFMINPTESGTTGSVGTTGTSGTIPTSRILTRTQGSLATVVGDATGPSPVLTFSSADGVSAVDEFRYANFPNAALSAMLAESASTWFQGFWKISVSDWPGLAWVQVELVAADGTASVVGFSPINTTAVDGGIAMAYGPVTIHTPRIQRSAIAQFRFRLGFGVYVGNNPSTGAPVTGTGTVTIHQSGIFAVEDPKIAFPLFNFLLKRDLDPTSNDNDPMWMKKAA